VLGWEKMKAEASLPLALPHPLERRERERRGEVSLGRARVGRFTLRNSAAAARGFGIQSTSAASTAGRGELDGQCFLFTCGRAMLMG
jgi:hypothetical protein